MSDEVETEQLPRSDYWPLPDLTVETQSPEERERKLDSIYERLQQLKRDAGMI